MKIDPANIDRKSVHDILVGAVLPRPIAFISTLGQDGVYNLAPYSFFIPVSMKPVLLGVGIGRKRDGSKKDTLVNIEWGKDFVVNLVTEALAEAMNQTAGEYPKDVDEFQVAGLTPIKADRVKSPRIAESPVNMECRLHQILGFGDSPRLNEFVLGEVLHIHVKDEYWVNGEIQSTKLKAIGRMGGDFYSRTADVFEIKRPVVPSKK